jgi:hypothetical protein
MAYYKGTVMVSFDCGQWWAEIEQDGTPISACGKTEQEAVSALDEKLKAQGIFMAKEKLGEMLLEELNELQSTLGVYVGTEQEEEARILNRLILDEKDRRSHSGKYWGL